MPVRFIGTSHVSKQSVSAVKSAFKQCPDFVCLELDARRLSALLHPAKRPSSMTVLSQVGFKGWLFFVVAGWIEHYVARELGTSPGSEMLSAYKLAVECGASVVLVDQDILVTLNKLSGAFTFGEKLRFVWELCMSPFSRPKFDVANVPSDKVVKDLLMDAKKNYPSLYRVLVVERNDFIARNLAALVKLNPDADVLVVLGAGHVVSVKKLLIKYLNA